MNRQLDFLLRQEFNRLWDSNSLFASDQKPFINKEEYFQEWKQNL